MRLHSELSVASLTNRKILTLTLKNDQGLELPARSPSLFCLRIVMAGLYSPMIPSLQNEKADIFHDHGVMFGITSIGYLGDYLDVTNHRVVTKEQFSKHYQIHEPGTWT